MNKILAFLQNSGILKRKINWTMKKTLCLNKCCEIFVHNPQFIYILQFSSLKSSRSAFRRTCSASNVIMMMSYSTPLRLKVVEDLSSVYNACHCKWLTFLTKFYILIQLKVVFWFIFTACRIIVFRWHHRYNFP